MKRLYGGHVLDQPGSVWRDAFAAGRCADQLGADAVRLGADPPDFELRFGSRVEPYEFVEVQAPGRRRGDELKAERRKSAAERERTLRIPQEEWTRSTVVLDALRKAVVSKSSKAYAPRTNLLILSLIHI